MTFPAWTELALKATLLLSAAGAMAFALRRASAATRHAVWTACMTALLAMPLLSLLLPTLDAPQAVAMLVSAQPEASASLPAVPAAFDWRAWVVRIWMAGAAAMALRFAAALILLRGVVRSARPALEWDSLAAETGSTLGLRRPVPVRLSARVSMPVSCGVFRPCVLLPEASAAWPEGRRRIVLLHEMAHAARRDPLTQIVAHAAGCLYWFHPLFWIAARRMSMDRERACDDRVLSTGAVPADYAAHLVEIARTLRGRRLWLSVALAMAARSQLEGRLAAILDPQRRRRSLTARAACAALALAGLVVVPLAATRPAGGSFGSVSGVVSDGTGVIPGTEVTLRNVTTGAALTATSGPDGGYRFPAVAPGGYEVRLRSPGFAERRIAPVRVEAGDEVRHVPLLRTGAITERLDVVAPRPASIRPPAAQPRRLRVGGNVQPPRLLFQEPPAYPPAARAAGAEGVAVLRASINSTGTVGDVAVIDAPHPALAEAARSAVLRWEYTPARLNGRPVAVDLEIQVRFQLTQ